MKREFLEQESLGLTPRQRLDGINFMTSLTDFNKKYEQLNEEERDELDLLQDVIMAAKDPTVEQHYFEQMKKFFIEKLDYEADLFKDQNLAQFNQQFNNLSATDKERDAIAEKFIPEVEERMHELNLKGIRLRAIKPQTAEIERAIQQIMDELKKLRDRREEVINAVYKTRHKKSIN